MLAKLRRATGMAGNAVASGIHHGQSSSRSTSFFVQRSRCPLISAGASSGRIAGSRQVFDSSSSSSSTAAASSWKFWPFVQSPPTITAADIKNHIARVKGRLEALIEGFGKVEVTLEKLKNIGNASAKEALEKVATDMEELSQGFGEVGMELGMLTSGPSDAILSKFWGLCREELGELERSPQDEADDKAWDKEWAKKNPKFTFFDEDGRHTLHDLDMSYYDDSTREFLAAYMNGFKTGEEDDPCF